MITEYEQYYCRTCDSIFNSMVHDSYYTLNTFVDNQQCLIEGVKHARNIIHPVYITNCPRCNSMHTVKVKPIVELMTRKQWLRDNKGCNQYTKERFKLYKRVMARITATKHLSTIKDK